MTFKSKFLGRRASKSSAKHDDDEQVKETAYPIEECGDECRDDLNPVERFFNNASSAFSGTVGEAQSMAGDIYTIATSDVESFVTTDDEEDDEIGAMERFLNSASSVFSGVVGEAQSMAEDIHSIATSDVDSVDGEKEEEEMDHSTLAQQVKKLGKLGQLIEKAEKQIMKSKSQIEKAEKEQKKTREIIKAHYAGVMSVPKKSDKEPNEKLSPLQRFFSDTSGAFEQAMGATNDDADLGHQETRGSNSKKLKQNHSALAKQIKKLGKLEQLVEKAEGQIIKYEKEIEMVEEEQEKTREVIDFLSNKLNIGNQSDDDDHGKATKKVNEVPTIGVMDSLSDYVGEEAARLAYQEHHAGSK